MCPNIAQLGGLDQSIMRLTKPFRCLVLVGWDTLSHHVHTCQTSLRKSAALLGSFSVPPCRFAMVHGYAQAQEIHVSKNSLRIRVALYSSLKQNWFSPTVPFRSFALVRRDTLPDNVHSTEHQLGTGVSLLGGLPQPLQRQAEILTHALPAAIHRS